MAGEQKSIGRTPLSERYVHVPNGIDLTPAGDVLALVPRSDRVDVVQLALDPGVPAILPPETSFAPLAPPVALACRSESQMLAVYTSYISNRKYLNNTNINGACSGRTKPRYLGAPGDYYSIPYDWNGWDGPSIFNSQMDGGKQAGDIDSPSTTCSRGTDCSGYISRVWALGSHCFTTYLPSVAYMVNVSQMLQFDIFYKSGSHVVAFHAAGGNGYDISDATTTNSIDRVTYRWVSSSWLNGYSPRRYNNRCT